MVSEVTVAFINILIRGTYYIFSYSKKVKLFSHQKKCQNLVFFLTNIQGKCEYKLFKLYITQKILIFLRKSRFGTLLSSYEHCVRKKKKFNMAEIF